MTGAQERDGELREAAQDLAVRLGVARRGGRGQLVDAEVLDEKNLVEDVRRRLAEADDRLAAFGGDVQLAVAWLQRVIAEAADSDD